MTDYAIQWLNSLIDQGIQTRLSDIHLEFVEEHPFTLNVRVRIAGDLQAWPGLEGPDARAVISRIKSIANVGSGAVRSPEEGRYLHRTGSSRLDPALSNEDFEIEASKLGRSDIRLVVLPTVRGEKLVLRLPSISSTPRVDQLGFSPSNLEAVAGLFAKPNGLILFAGPVGAGKTTSMYSALDYLGGEKKAAYSVEDPVERQLPNVDQIEVNDGAGNSFGSILRSLRRSDLQVLMIGEIRDQETAYSAIQISIAGARVISSIHANDSIAAIEAMLALSGANPHQVMQSLRGVISQRLVKVAHADCRGAGCDGCGRTGIGGRAPIHEVLPITPEFAEAVARGEGRARLTELAIQAGMKSLREDATRRLASGETRQDWVTEVLGSE